MIDFTYSDWKTIQHGVPQGSIFRPLLFNLFINDLTYSVDDAKLRLYADDTTLYLSHPYQDVLESRSQSKFDVLQSWFKCKYLNMNESKTNHWMPIRHTTNCLLTVLGHHWRWYTIWSYYLKRKKNASIYVLSGHERIEKRSDLSSWCWQSI